MTPFFKEERSETPMFRCPGCQGIVVLGNSSCRYCGILIDDATARRLNASFLQVTDAVASANTFRQSIWIAVFLTVASSIYVIGFSEHNPRFLLASAAPIGFVSYVISWRRKYGRLETADKDYPEAVQAMRRSLLVWAAALLIQGGVLAWAFSSRVFDHWRTLE